MHKGNKAVSLDYIPSFKVGKVGQKKSLNFGLWSAHLISYLFTGQNTALIKLFMMNLLFEFLARSWGFSEGFFSLSMLLHLSVPFLSWDSG